MTRVLALDASTGWGSVALVSGEAPPREPLVVAELGIAARTSHSAHLLRWIDRLLAEAGWDKSSVELYAATRGPGSFTGIRVGLGTVRGLSLATGRGCRGVTTLEALAEAHGPAAGERLPLIDAGRGELFGARYDARSSPPVELEPPWVATRETALEGRAGAGRLLIPAPGTDLAGLQGEGATVARPPRSIAAAVGRLVLLDAGTPAEAGQPLAPLYVRPPDVRLRREGS